MRLLRPSPRLVTPFAALCLAVAGCGTDIHWLLKRDSALVTKADEIATAAEASDPELTKEMYDAEDAKREACEKIYKSISEQMTHKPSYGEELESDLGLFVAYMVPIDEVERCAKALDRYQATVDHLQERMKGQGTAPGGTKAPGG